ncbi:MAG: hypothetical protein IJX87_04840 [Clostridia bacterium]|nr:hypothetical protein [Clostridia bacterium]
MKKLLCVLMVLTAVFCFAGCTDGKCDGCETKENVKVYTTKDDKEVEYCPKCYAEKVADNVLGGLLG